VCTVCNQKGQIEQAKEQYLEKEEKKLATVTLTCGMKILKQGKRKLRPKNVKT